MAWQKNGCGFKRRMLFSRAEDRKKFAFLMIMTINFKCWKKKQQQLMQQAMNSVRQLGARRLKPSRATAVGHGKAFRG